MRYLLSAALLFGLTACGADGPPEPPSRAMPQDGIVISGEARLGVVTEL